MAIFDKLQSMGGNYISRLGGADIYKQDELQELAPEELTAYNQQKDSAKTAGMREFASRLSDAFAGRDITGRAAEREKLNIIKKKNLKRKKKNRHSKISPIILIERIIRLIKNIILLLAKDI